MSIDSLKTTIGRRQGVAQPNRFAIYIPTPIFNTDNVLRNVISAGIAGGSVAAGINSLYNDPRDLTFLCRTAVLPGRQMATTDYATNTKTHKMPYAGITDDLALTFILTQITDPNFFRILTKTNTHNIYGTVLGYDSSTPPETVLVSASGNSVKMVSSGSTTLTIGSRISVISNGVNYYILDDSSAAPLEIV